MNNVNYESDNQGCSGCLFWIVILFVLLATGVIQIGGQKEEDLPEIPQTQCEKILNDLNIICGGGV